MFALDADELVEEVGVPCAISGFVVGFLGVGLKGFDSGEARALGHGGERDGRRDVVEEA